MTNAYLLILTTLGNLFVVPISYLYSNKWSSLAVKKRSIFQRNLPVFGYFFLWFIIFYNVRQTLQKPHNYTCQHKKKEECVFVRLHYLKIENYKLELETKQENLQIYYSKSNLN